jgi:hypothetical protein
VLIILDKDSPVDCVLVPFVDVRDVAHDVVGDGGADMVAVVLVHSRVVHVG